MLLNAGDSKAAIKVVPWGVIMMVCGVTVLVEVMDRSGGLNAMVNMIGVISGPVTVNFWLGLFTGIISAYSSSSGVVMPMFLPLCRSRQGSARRGRHRHDFIHQHRFPPLRYLTPVDAGYTVHRLRR